MSLPPNAKPTAWRVVWWFGIVSLCADMVYEGARSMYGPLLGALGASATVVGLITGAGEAAALLLRLVFGPMADRQSNHWSLTIIGYAMTAVCVPLLAVSVKLGSAGLVVAALLILADRTGKAVRSPSKSALLAHVAAAVGRGRGFGVHKALDQIGAFSGPLLVAAVVSMASIWTAMAVLAIPGAAAMTVLLRLRKTVPHPADYDETSVAESTHDTRSNSLSSWLRGALGTHLPPQFFSFALAAGLMTGGLVSYAIIGFHLTERGLVALSWVPILYALAMAVQALAALGVGSIYDRCGAHVLLGVPVLIALVPALALSSSIGWVLLGMVLWAVAYGIQDSTIKALVAEIVAAPHRATAYGVFAGIQGLFAIIGGTTAGWLYDDSLSLLVAFTALTQVAALVVLATTLRRVRRTSSSPVG